MDNILSTQIIAFVLNSSHVIGTQVQLSGGVANIFENLVSRKQFDLRTQNFVR